jgi:hypothetical protein
MKKVNPYKSQAAALKSLDNGGRFFNVLTKADDGQITSTELSKVAGAFSNKQLMNLYLEMSLAQLPKRDMVLRSLSDKLNKAYQRNRPQYLSPAEAATSGQVGATVIITGIPEYKRAKTEFSGFIMVPIISGDVTTFIMVPIMDQYDIYEVKDQQSDELFIIAHARSKRKLDNVPTRVGGYLKELQVDKKNVSEKRLFLETYYYTPLNLVAN